VGGVGQEEKHTANDLEAVLLRPWPPSVPFLPTKEQREGQRDETARSYDLRYGTVATNPFDRDVLEGDDQHSQQEEADSPDIGTDSVIGSSQACSPLDDR
jgi:hypothetical protein